MTKFGIFIGFAIALQLISNGNERVMAQNYPANYPAPVNVQKRTTPVGGISVEHPLQATVYAYRRGKMKLLVPFEITVVPMGGIGAERPPAANGYPYAGQIQPQPQPQPQIQIQQPQPQQQQQPGARYPPYNGNIYNRLDQQPAGVYQGSPHYYPISNSYQQPYNPYNAYSPSNSPNTNYFNQQAVQNPYYNQPPRRVGFPQYRPQFQQPQVRPQIHPPWPRQNATNATLPNWPQNNTAININNLLDNMKNVTHQLNATTLTPSPTPTPTLTPTLIPTLTPTPSLPPTLTPTLMPSTAPPLLNTTTSNTTTSKKPVRVRKPTKTTTAATATAAAAANSTSNSSEVPAIVKEIPPKPSALTLARLPEIDEMPIADLDLGYLIPSNFAPKSPMPFVNANSESTGSSGIL